jgi:hypothetical protein
MEQRLDVSTYLMRNHQGVRLCLRERSSYKTFVFAGNVIAGEMQVDKGCRIAIGVDERSFGEWTTW